MTHWYENPNGKLIRLEQNEFFDKPNVVRYHVNLGLLILRGLPYPNYPAD